MPRYRSEVHHNGLNAGEIVDIEPDLVGQWEGEIDAGFLTPLDPPTALERDYYQAAQMTEDQARAAAGMTVTTE